MFNKKKIDGYLRASDKIKIPGIDEGKVSMIDNRKKAKKIFNRVAAVAACSCLFLIGNMFVGINNSESNRNNKNNGNIFSVIAVSAAEEGSGVTLDKGVVNSLPTGQVNLDGSGTLSQLALKGQNVQTIDLSCKNGYLESIYGISKIEGDSEIYVTGDNTEEMKKNGENIGEGMQASFNGKNFNEVNYREVTWGKEIRINTVDDMDEYTFSWMPKEMAIGMEEGITDLSSLEGDEILAKVTFKDGTVEETTIVISYNEKGEILATLK